MRLRIFPALLFFTATLSATTITLTLPEFNGPWQPDGPYPASPVNVGTFSFAIPYGQHIVSAVLTGSFGNSEVVNTSGVDLYGDGVRIAQCLENDICDTATDGTTPFQYSFNSASFGLFTDGSFAVTAVQTSPKEIRLGAETLTLETECSSVPEPASFALLAAGLLLPLWRFRRKLI